MILALLGANRNQAIKHKSVPNNLLKLRPSQIHGFLLYATCKRVTDALHA